MEKGGKIMQIKLQSTPVAVYSTMVQFYDFFLCSSMNFIKFEHALDLTLPHLTITTFMH